MSNGYVGKILVVDLTTKTTSTLNTSDYSAKWGGGHGMGSAVFWDLCTDKTVSCFDPANVVTLFTSPLSGTPTPAVAHTEVQGIGAQGFPNEWFTRSNFGGRFSAQLKYAGFDGMAVLGKAAAPVYIDIRDSVVQVLDATGVWGLDAYAAQEEIWRRVQADMPDKHGWDKEAAAVTAPRTTQKPAVLAIGKAGETLSRMASLVHDAGNGSGQGGFGGVFGSKNLKAISVIGTGAINIANPVRLWEAREWAMDYAAQGHWDATHNNPGISSMFASDPGNGSIAYRPEGVESAPQGCAGCNRACRNRFKAANGNGSQCVDFLFYNSWDAAAHGGKNTQGLLDSVDAMQRAGINAYMLEGGIIWLVNLYKKGILGKGKAIDTNLPFDKVGEKEFALALIDAICNKTDIGADLHDGLARCAVKWGRYDIDTTTGDLPLQAWGYPQHYDARTETEWGYGSLIGDRDINEHDFNLLCYWMPSVSALIGAPPLMPAEDLANTIGDALLPYKDPEMVNYSDTAIYSDSMAKLVAWHRHYTRYWKQSILYCDWAWSDFANQYGPGMTGVTPQGEPKFLNAVTGDGLTFEDGMEIGRRIWNLDRAVWVLQGRHRDMELFTEQNYQVGSAPGFSTYEVPYVMPVHEGGKWSYKSVTGRKLDKASVEVWKTKYFTLEGWNTTNGWPTRATLEGLGMKNVADALEAASKLG